VDLSTRAVPAPHPWKAVALATSANWAFNFALGYFVPPAFENIAWKTYIIFGVFCVAMFIHVFFMFPETSGKPLEEVVEIFEDPNGIPYIGTPAWKTRNTRSKVARNEAGHDLEGFRRAEKGRDSLGTDTSPERKASQVTEPAKSTL